VLVSSQCLALRHNNHVGSKILDWIYVTAIRLEAVIHQVAQAGFPEEPPKNEQAMLIHAEFSDSAGPEKAPFSVFPLL
jgi:hypothetical protein